MRRTILVTSCLIACLATACQRAPQAPAAAQATAATTQAVASTRVGNVTLQTSTVATADYHTKGFYPFYGKTCVNVTGQ